MNPIGIALVFMIFGAIIGVGLFLVVRSLSGLQKQRALHFSAMHSFQTYRLKDLLGIMGRSLLALLGIAMIYQGTLWIYIVVFR